MFTGIVQNVGTIAALSPVGETATIRIETPLTATSRIGESVAVDGICLTITACDAAGFTTTVMPETVRRTNLAGLQAGDAVDLELALAADGRLDGHFVLGHVDQTTPLISRKREQNAVVLRFALPSESRRYVVAKGSVALNGVSLTITTVDATSFGVSLIPHTLDETVLGTLAVGDFVNVEYDILGKYLVRQQEVEADA